MPRLPEQAEETKSEMGFNPHGENGIHAVLRYPPIFESSAVNTGQEHSHPGDTRPREPEPQISMFMAPNIPAVSGPQGQLGRLNSISTEQHLDTLDWIRHNRARILAEGSRYRYGATLPGDGPQEQDSETLALAILAFRIISPTDQSLNADAGSANPGPPGIGHVTGGFVMNEKPKSRTRTRSAPTGKREIPGRPANEPSTARADTSRKNNKRKVSVKTESLADEGSISDVSASKRVKRAPKNSAGKTGGSN